MTDFGKFSRQLLPTLPLLFRRFLSRLGILLLILPATVSAQYDTFERPFLWPDPRVGLPQEQIHSLAMAPDGGLFIGSASGLFLWNGENAERLSGHHGVPMGDYHSLSVIDEVLYGVVDSMPFRFDGADFSEVESAPEPVHTPGEYPRIEAPGGLIYTGTERGLLIEYDNGWERLVTEACDMPWSVMPSPDGDGFILPCHLFGYQEYNEKGQLIRRYPLPMDGLSSDGIQLFPGYYCDEEFGCVTGGFLGVYSLKNDKVRFWGNFGNTIEAFSWDPVTRQLMVAGNSISFLRPDGTVIRDQIDIPDEAVSVYSASDMLVEQDAIWVTGISGAARYDRAAEKWDVYSIDNEGFPVRKAFNIHRTPHGRLFIGHQNGVALWNDTTRRFDPWLPELIEDMTGQVMSWHRDTLIVATATHCHFFHENSDSLHLIASYGPSEGLDLIELNENGAMIDGKDRLYLPGSEGIHRFDLKRLRGISPGPMDLDIERVGEVMVPFEGSEEKEYPHHGKSLELEFRRIGNLAMEAVLEYRLDNGKWKLVRDVGALTIPVLRPGRRLIELRARIPGMARTFWPRDQILVRETWPLIQYPSIQRLLILIIALVVIMLIYYNYIAYRERRQLRRLRWSMMEATDRAMELQFNPNFILKGIEGIRHSIERGEKKKASQYLVHLARTLRQLLDISLEGNNAEEELSIKFNSLEKELQFLRSLIQLEQNRRPGEFSFLLSVDDQLWEEDPVIPSLLLPPVAIWIINLDNDNLTPVGQLRLTIDGTLENISIVWEAQPVEGRKFNISELWFTNSLEGQNLAERARIFRLLGYELTIEPTASEDTFRLVMNWRGAASVENTGL